MKSREEIKDELTEDYRNKSYPAYVNSLELIKIGILLDIRDQNDTIISLLSSMKKYLVSSNDINISKVCD